MIGRYRKVYVRIWGDEKFRALSQPQPNAQTLWLYLLTGEHTSAIPGLFRSGESSLAEALGWPLKGFREAFAEVFHKGMARADWKARLVLLPKAVSYNPPESPNVVKAWRAAFDEMPECPLKREAFRHFQVFLEGLSEGFRKAWGEPLPNQEQEQEQEQSQEQEQDPEAANAAASTSTRNSGSESSSPKQNSKNDRVSRMAHRLPDDFALTEEMRKDMVRLGVADLDTTFEAFCDYWRAKPKDNLKLDWDAALRSWCRREGKDISNGNGALAFARPRFETSQDKAKRQLQESIRADEAKLKAGAEK